ncbi:hypothetical protein H1R20_g6923, partial [Candolleomyces eurysporus]
MPGDKYETCSKAGVQAARSLFGKVKERSTECPKTRLLRALVEVSKAIHAARGIGDDGRGLLFKMAPTEDFNELEIEACLTESREDIYLTDVVVPLSFQCKRTYGSVRQNRFLTASAVRCIMKEDLRRRFTFAITAEESRMTLWYFSRSHSMKSRSFDYVEDPNKLVSVMMSLMFTSNEELGLDPRVTLLSTPTTKQFIYELPSVGESQFFLATHSISQRGPYSGIYGRSTRVFRVQEVEKGSWEPKSDTKPMVLKDAWVGQAARPEKEIQEELFRDIQTFAEDPDWRRSKCLEFFQKKELEPTMESFGALLPDEKYKNLFLVVKQDFVGSSSKAVVDGAWAPKARIFCKRSEIYRNHPYSTSQLHAMTLGDPDRVDAKEAGKSDLKAFAPMRRYFVLFEDECTTIDDLPNVGSAISVLGQCMTALLLMFCAGWVHRDISPGNIMALEDSETGQWSVKLADLEYAKKFPYDKGKRSGESDPKLGTPCFMAHEILAEWYLGYDPMKDVDVNWREQIINRTIDLRDLTDEFEPVIHNFQHDVEAIFWIVLWIFTLRVGHQPSANYARPAFEPSMTLSFYRRSMFLVNSSEDLRECLLAPLKLFAGTICIIRGVLRWEAHRRGRDRLWYQPESYSQIHAIVGLAFRTHFKDSSTDWAKIPLQNSSKSRPAQLLSDNVPKPIWPSVIDTGSDSEPSSGLAQPPGGSQPLKNRKRSGTAGGGEEDCGREARRRRRKSSDESSKPGSPKPGLRENSRYGLRPTVKAPRR